MDAPLLAEALEGRRDALVTLVERIQTPVRRALRRVFSDHPPDAIDDICQEALLRVLDRLDHFAPHGRARFTTWAVTVAIRVGLDVTRRRNRRSRRELALVAVAAEPAADPRPGPERLAQRRQLAHAVERSMQQLTAEQRSVLVLRAFHDLTYDEIGEALGIPRAAVRSRLQRARAALREALRGYEEDRR